MSAPAKPGRWRRQAGMTLIEVLAAALILGVALAPMLDIMRHGLISSRRVESISRSLILAASTYEDLKAKIQSRGGSYGFGLDYNLTATAFPPPDAEYKKTIADNQAAALRTLKITVWHDENGSNAVDNGEVSVVLDTKVADRR